ncbi:MAG: quinoprotein dehydrogenase-associated SoxYZ-like carrier [Rhizobiaceae bacterium]
MRMLLFAASVLASPALAAELPADPLRSVMWNDMVERFLPGNVVFDDRVKVMVPKNAEDQFFVPVTVDAQAISNVKEIVILADLNPIPKVLSFKPENAAPFIGTRIKVEQSTPVRAAVRTSDGVWHVGGSIIDAAGGGCSAPAQQYKNANWAETLGQTRAAARREDAETARVSLRIRHPMDTGLADGIPAFYLSHLTVTADGGRSIGAIESYEPVSENPTFTLKAKVSTDETALAFNGRDNEGNTYSFRLPVPTSQGASN